MQKKQKKGDLLAYPLDFFEEGSITNMFTSLLLWFQAISGLTINVCKGELFPLEEIQEAEDMTRVVAGKAIDLLATFLRLPMGSTHED